MFFLINVFKSMLFCMALRVKLGTLASVQAHNIPTCIDLECKLTTESKLQIVKGTAYSAQVPHSILHSNSAIAEHFSLRRCVEDAVSINND